MFLKNLTSVAVVFSLMLSAVPLTAIAEGEVQAMTDSGMNYQESTETINNPGAGYTTTLWYRCKPGETAVQNPSGNLVLMFVDIGAFSSGANGTTSVDSEGNSVYTEGTDYDLDEQFFTAMRGTLENCRKNGSTVAVRFRYDADGKTNPEPASFAQVLHHIEQIKQDGFLEDYKDILMYIESGFVGAWGEQHSGKYTSLEYKAQLLDAVLDMTPDDIPVTVRTPNIFAKWAGIETKDLAEWISEPDSQASRIGLYNDGYMGSDSDLGTYSNREIETTWLGNQAVRTYYGGEFSGALDWAKKYDTWEPQNAIPEMYKTHLSYINSNIYTMYRDYTFSEQYDVSGVDNSAYYGQTVFKFIRDHLGYRFVVRDCELNRKAEQGSTFQLDFSVENTGFANSVRPQNAEIILEKDGIYIVQNVAVDSREWYSRTTSQENLEIEVPANLEAGEWNVYLRLSVGNQGIPDGNLRTVQFANPDVWNASLGANKMGSVQITETTDISKKANYQTDMYDSGNVVIFDGIRSSESEWTEQNLIAESGENKLYMSADDKYLYIGTEVHHNVSQPVWNLRLEHDGESYWIYYQSAGWCYYSKGEEHTGFDFRKSEDFAEFKIDMSSMNIQSGTVFDKVRIFVQDEGDGWKAVGDLVAEDITVNTVFPIYSAYQKVSLKEHQSYTMQAVTSLDNVSYQWLKDGKEISGADSRTLILNDVSQTSAGDYSVRITAENGTAQEILLYTIENIYPAEFVLKGDLNADSAVDSKDIKLLQDYLHKRDVYIQGDADINQDGIWNIYDLILLKRSAK
ncbi:MAG: DUF4832 domain-containing protein [Oscillospiraceae bacterium]|nr:DUF4832 domain-containing protein [Oscillospiraceae bacterium]